MNDQELDRIRALAAQFQEDRKMEGLLGYSRWPFWYLLDFLKERDESDVTAVTTDTLHKFQLDLYHRRGRRKAALSLVSQSYALGVTRMFFQWLARRGHILADPSSGVKLPKRKQILPPGVLTRREVERVLAAPDVETPRGLRDRAMLELLYSSGLRNSEARNLKVYDVNTAQGEALVKEGKGGKDRVVPVGEVAAKYIDLYMKEARPKILKEREDPGYLFLGRQGGRINTSSLNEEIVQRHVRGAGIKKHVTAHGLRHTCATHLLRGRASLRHIQALLGHRSLESTQIYTRVEVGDLKRELRRCHPREQSQ